MRWQFHNWWDVYICVASLVAIAFGAFAKDEWLKWLRYRDMTQPSPPMARIILIATGVVGILISYYDWSHGY